MVFFFVIREQTAGVIETLGRFSRIARPGLHFKMPWERVAGRLSLRIQELQVNVETKTKDDVFVRLLIAVQYYVISDRAKEAFYRLSNPVMQIESYVFDEVRSAVPGMHLDDVFQNKEYIAKAVQEGLEETMTQYGYGIARALVNDIDPDAKVKASMNEINAAQRMRKAAEERGEAEKILKVKQAQGEAESKILQGKGIAGQRKAIVDGLRESVEEFQRGVPGVTSNDVMQLVLMTQYFDMLKDVGQTSRTNTIMLPHSPGALGDLSGQLREAILIGNVAADEHRETSADADREERMAPKADTSGTDYEQLQRAAQHHHQQAQQHTQPQKYPPTRPPR